MGRIKSFLICGLLLVWIGFAQAATYTLTDGQSITGDPVSYDKDGVVLKSDSGSFQPRTPWSKFSQESLKQLASQAKRRQDAAHIEPFLEETIAFEKKVKAEIVIQPPPRVELPEGRTGLFAWFATPLGFVVFLVLYGANIFAAREVAFYRYQPFPLVGGISAVAPIIGPIIFLCMPPRLARPSEEPAPAEVAEQAPVAEATVEDTSAPPAAFPAAPAMPRAAAPSAAPRSFQLGSSVPGPQSAAPAPSPQPVPQTVAFRRGEFTFNRRFFETKVPGFFRIVPSEADKDLVLYIKAARGEFLGKRISNINQIELYLLTFKEDVTAEEMIPFTEIQEVQIRHKDMV